MQLVKTIMISMLNDKFRKSGFGVTLTCGVQSVQDLPGLLRAVQDFDDFTGDNDPYGEHDFGRLDWHGDKIFWKMDYFNQTLDEWADPFSKDCRRVITVMLADEY